MRGRGPFELAFVAALLALFAALAVSSLRAKNPTFDETAHLGAGLSYVETGDYRLNPEHPALPKLLAGAAARAAGARMPADPDAWERSDQWDFGHAVLYGDGADWRRILFAARLPMVAIGVLLGATLWLWARAMIGGAGAAVALSLFAFSPTLLAHTRLVTTDVPLAFAVTAAAACLWAGWRSGRVAWTIAAGVFVGLSMATKYSAFSYGPVWILLAVWPSAQRPGRRGIVHLGAFLAASIVATLVLVSASYGFAAEWTTIRSIGMAGRGIGPEEMGLVRRIPYEILATVPWPHPAFAEGMKDVLLYVEAGHPVFLLGERAEAGWWWSPFVALGVKTPLPFLLLVLAAAVLVARSRALRRGDLLFLLAPAALVLLTNVLAKLGLGVRHLLPLLPFLMLFAAWPLRGGGFRGGLASMAALVVLLLFQATGVLRAHPHYLSYFHVLAGGPRGGAALLGDSNLDWGQDLSLAAERLRARGIEGAILCYFGTADPFVEDVDWQLLPPTRRGRDRDPWVVLPPDPELWLAMSTTNLQGVYYRGPGGEDGPPYPWLDGIEPAEIVGGSIRLYDLGDEHEAQRGLVEAYARHGLREEAEATLRRLLERWRFDLESRRRLVALLESQGRLVDAEEVILRTPNPEAEEILRLADFRKRRGDWQGAIDAYETGVRGFPSETDIRNEFAWSLQEMGEDLPRARSLVEDALRWRPDDPFYLDTRGMVLRAMDEPDSALASFEAALARAGEPMPEIEWHRALALIEAGRDDEGLAVAEDLRARPDLSTTLRETIEAWFWELEN